MPRSRLAQILACLGLLALMAPAPAATAADVIGYEMSVAQIEAGRLRHLAERLAKQNTLFQLRLGSVRKEDLVRTATRIDRVIETLENGSPGYSVPPPWTRELRDRLEKVDHAWQPLRSIAVASQIDYLRRGQQYGGSTRSDPLMIRYFDGMAADLVTASEELMRAYGAECKGSSSASPELCVTASLSGMSAMLSERATKEAVYIVGGIEPKKNRAGLAETIEAYGKTRKVIAEMPFFATALSPERGESAVFARNLLLSVQSDWDDIEREFQILGAGDESNFDLDRLLQVQERMVGRIERFTAAMVRYANIAYGV